jgi:hypothetical protein
MIAELLLSQGATNTAAGLSAVRVPFGSGAPEDLYAIWNSVFEHAHADIATRDGQSVPDGGQKAPHDHHQGGVQGDGRPRVPASVELEGTGGAGAPAGLVDSFMPGIKTATAAGVAPEAIVSADRDDGVADEPSATAQQIEHRDDATASVATGGTEAAADSQATRGSGAHVTTAFAGSAPTEAASADTSQRVAAESVSIFVHDSGVALVVRDAMLSDQDGMQSAFETAQALTGQRAALQRFTLNGRTLYQQQPGPDAGRAKTAPTLVFAC